MERQVGEVFDYGDVKLKMVTDVVSLGWMNAISKM